MKIIKKDLCLQVSHDLHLKILEKADVSKKYVDWLNNYEITRFTEQKNYTHSISSVEKYVDQKFLSKDEFLFGIFYKKNHVGNIKLGPIKWDHMTSEVSFFVGNKVHWGKQITTESLKKIIKFSKSELRIKKINAGYYIINKGSAKVFRNCGFEIEGIKKNEIIYEGRRIDTVIVGYTG